MSDTFYTAATKPSSHEGFSPETTVNESTSHMGSSPVTTEKDPSSHEEISPKSATNEPPPQVGRESSSTNNSERTSRTRRQTQLLSYSVEVRKYRLFTKLIINDYIKLFLQCFKASMKYSGPPCTTQEGSSTASSSTNKSGRSSRLSRGLEVRKLGFYF